MILTICLSPCIDVNVEVDSLSVGKSHNVINKRVFCTGKALNVATGLAKLDSECFATGFMYEDNGRLFEHDLHENGVPYKFVWCKGRVRENYKFIDNKSMLTEIDDVSSPVGVQKENELLDLVKELARQCNAVVISGGLPKDLKPDFYGKILSLVPSDVKRIVDSEGERLLSALAVGGVDLVKPNLEELRRTVKMPIQNNKEALTACNVLLDKGAKIVLLSLGKDGAIITDGIKSYSAKSVNVAMNSTVGAGDAMVSAATDALVKGGTLPEILRCGMAAGTAAVTLPDSISFKREKYDEVLSMLAIEEIFD